MSTGGLGNSATAFYKRLASMFVTLSTKMLNSLEKIVMLAEKSLSWSSTPYMEPFLLALPSYSGCCIYTG